MAAGAAGHHGAGTILVVDDDEFVAGSFAAAACRAGHRSIHAASLAEAVPLLKQRVAGAILDVVLPDGCGLDLIPLVRRSNRRVPIIVVTGANSAEVANRAHLLEAEYACKPNLFENVACFLRRCAVPPAESLADILDEFAIRHRFTRSERHLLEAAVETTGHEALAKALGVTDNTVKKHIARILLKTSFERLEDFISVIRARSVRR